MRNGQRRRRPSSVNIPGERPCRARREPILAGMSTSQHRLASTLPEMADWVTVIWQETSGSGAETYLSLPTRNFVSSGAEPSGVPQCTCGPLSASGTRIQTAASAAAFASLPPPPRARLSLEPLAGKLRLPPGRLERPSCDRRVRAAAPPGLRERVSSLLISPPRRRVGNDHIASLDVGQGKAKVRVYAAFPDVLNVLERHGRS